MKTENTNYESIQEEYEKNIDSLTKMSLDLVVNNTKLALNYADQALEMSHSHKYLKGIANSLLSKGIVYERLSDYSSGLESLLEALQLFRNLDDRKGEARTLNTLGMCYFCLAKFQDSMDCFQSSLKLSREIGYHENEVKALNNIGEIYRELDKPDEALVYYNSSLSIIKKNEEKLTYGVLLMNIAHLHYILGDLKKASSSYRKSIQILKVTGEERFIAEGLTKLGEIYLDYGKYKPALQYLQNSLDICRKHEDRYLEASALHSLSKAKEKQGNLPEALQYLQLALKLAQEIQANKVLAEVHLSLASMNEKIEDYKSSVTHFKEYNRIIKDLTSEEYQKKLEAASIQNKLEQAQKEAEIFRLKNIELKQKADEIQVKASELEQSYNHMYIISEIGRKITSSLDLEKILNTLYKSVNSLMDASCFGVGLYHAKSSLIEYKLFVEKSRRLPISYKPVTSEESLAAWCIRNNKAVLCNDLELEYEKYMPQLSPETLQRYTKSVIYCPIVVKSAIMGIITVQSYEKNAYSTYNLDTLKALASYLAIALNNSAKSEEIKKKAALLSKEISMRKHAQSSLEKANQKLETLLSVDVLTGISNRRSFERFARQLWKQAVCNSLPISLMLMDIDFFKQYNDTYGHPEGDKCLRKVSSCLQESIRKPCDFVARYGGEEFLVILPETDSKEASIIAERLRKKVEDLKIRHRKSTVSKYVTISIGISTVIPNKQMSLKQFLTFSDKALYEAKNAGRNCVRINEISRQVDSFRSTQTN